MNDRLDYFGSTANIASRLEHLTSGGDVVVSETNRGDRVPGAQQGPALGRSASDNAKGFDGERFSLRRITAAD